MTRATHRAAKYTRAQVDALNAEVLGIATREEIDRLQTVPFPPYAIIEGIRAVDGLAAGGTHLGDLISTWVKEDNPTGSGRKTAISSRAFLCVMLMHAIAHEDLTMTHMAHTAARRLSAEQRSEIGLPELWPDSDIWRGRLDQAHKILLKRIDTHPYPGHLNRQKRLTADQLQELDRYWARPDVAQLIQMRNERLLDLMFELVANAARFSTPLLTDFHGYLALDATFTPILGDHTAKSHKKDARSRTPEAGLYGRHGNHYVAENGTRVEQPGIQKFGFETEILTTTVGDGLNGPDLIVGIGLHRPGEISNVAGELIPRLERLGWPLRQLSVDRAYNNLDPATFHHIVLRHGLDAVYDYPADELGAKETFTSGMKFDKGGELIRDNRAEQNEFLLVDGQWYVRFIRPALITATFDALRDKDDPNWISKAQRDEYIEQRRAYQLTPWSNPDEDGYQRYELPKKEGYIPLDPITEQIVAYPKARTVTIPLAIGDRWKQKYPYKTPEWKEAFNLRSGVERVNNLLKHPTLGDLANPHKRPAAGYTATALAVAILAAAHNINAANFYLRANDPDILLINNRHIQTRPKQRSAAIPMPANPRRRRAA